MTRWSLIKDRAVSVIGALAMFFTAAMIVVSLVEEFGWLILLVTLGIVWAVLKPILIVVGPPAVILGIWLLIGFLVYADDDHPFKIFLVLVACVAIVYFWIAELTGWLPTP